jgi:hypothetical protein
MAQYSDEILHLNKRSAQRQADRLNRLQVPKIMYKTKVVKVIRYKVIADIGKRLKDMGIPSIDVIE